MPAVLLLRHALSTWNEDGRWQGQADPPLSALGEAHTLQAAARLRASDPFGLIVSSDLLRASQTAELMASALPFDGPLTPEIGLREYDVGRWSGLTREEISASWPDELARFERGDLDTPPGGESRRAFDLRVAAAGRRVAAQASASGAGRVLVVTHAGVLRSLARQAGVAEQRIGHLAGYSGVCDEGGLHPRDPTDLLSADPPGDPGDRDTAELCL